MRMPKLGDFVMIDFDDHSSSDGVDELFRATAHGKVVKVEDDRIVIDCWHATDPECPRRLAANELETFAIVRKAITNISRVTEWEEL